MRSQRLVLGAVACHFLLTALHAAVHAAVPVVPSAWPAAIAVVSLFVLPIAGAALTVRGRPLVGAGLLLAAGLAGFAFEAVFHFVAANPDHVAHVAAHRHSFAATAVLTTAGDLLLVPAAWLSVRGIEGPRAAFWELGRPVRRFFE
jgi:hypothetical protein